jgi:hypothetical protein
MSSSITVGATTFLDFYKTGFVTEQDGWAVVKFLENATVKKYIDSSAHAAITDIHITCGGDCTAAIVPDSWGTPTSSVTVEAGFAGVPCPVQTTTYMPKTTVPMDDYIVPQIFPKVLSGEPPLLWLHTTGKKKVTVNFTIWRHGFKPQKPF